MAINDWPEQERPREKLLHKGPQALSDAEILAIFLRTGHSGTSAVDLAMKLRAYPYEVFACLYLDNRHRLISFDELFRGTIDSAQVHAREVVRAAIKHNAAAVIFSHNHPSGVAEPSQADIRLTGTLKEALAMIDVRVLDHLVIGSG